MTALHVFIGIMIQSLRIVLDQKRFFIADRNYAAGRPAWLSMGTFSPQAGEKIAAANDKRNNAGKSVPVPETKKPPVQCNSQEEGKPDPAENSIQQGNQQVEF